MKSGEIYELYPRRDQNDISRQLFNRNYLLMALIGLEGMRFFAYHGFYPEEQILGTDYIVDVYLETDFSRAAAVDDLYQTINYETVHRICDIEMRCSSKLMEAVASRIVIGLKRQFPSLAGLKVRIRKLHPPLAGPVDNAVVEVDGNFQAKCGRCGTNIRCYGDASCWCHEKGSRVYQSTNEHLKLLHGGKCLCSDCLEFFTV